MKNLWKHIMPTATPSSEPFRISKYYFLVDFTYSWILDNTLRETRLFSKNSIFWDITTPCSVLEVNQRFGGNSACIFRVEEARNHKQSRAPSLPHRAPINPEPFPDLPPLFFPSLFPIASLRALPAIWFMLISCLATWSSETLVVF
jgi:hypothetical protein